jgi:hypothetical protein
MKKWDSNKFKYQNWNESYDSLSDLDYQKTQNYRKYKKTLNELFNEKKLYCIDRIYLGKKEGEQLYRYREYYQRIDDEVNRIHQWGCLITCMADIISYYGYKGNHNITPDIVNEKMNKMNSDAAVDDMEKRMVMSNYFLRIFMETYVRSNPALFQSPDNSKRGYKKDTSQMATYNVAVAYGFKFELFPKEKQPEVYDKDQFLPIIERRILQDKPSILTLVGEDGKTHFVVVVGISYPGVDSSDKATDYIIHDPGTSETSDRVKYISCETGFSEFWQRTIKRVGLVDR